MGRVSGRSIGSGTGGSGSSGSASSGGSSGSTSGSSGSASSGGGRPGRVSVFTSPPPQTVTVIPPSMEAPVKPTRVDVHDPSTEMSFKPFGDILTGVFGEPTQPTGVSTDPFRTVNGTLAILQPQVQEPTPKYEYVPEEALEVSIEQEEQVLPPSTCPRNCSIVHIPTGIVAVDNRMCSCSTIDRYQQDPNYRVEFTTQLPEVPVEEPVVSPLTWYYVKKPSGICERLNVSQNFVDKMTQQGWIFSLTDICPTTEDILPPEEEEESYVYTQCIDVYRLSNGSVMATRETVDYQTMADYVNVQHLLVRDCGRDVPSDQEVRDYYGYTPPTTTCPCGISDGECKECPPTTTANFGIAGILFAGVLALPILAGLGKWK